MLSKVNIIFIFGIIISVGITYAATSSFYDYKLLQITSDLKIDEWKLKIDEWELRTSEAELRTSGDEIKELQESELQSQQQEIDLKTLLFQRNIDTRADIVSLLADTVEIQSFATFAQYANGNGLVLDESIKESVQNKLHAFTKSDLDIDQVRILDMGGIEIIRIDKHDGNLHIHPDAGLQDKSDMYYFKEAIKLDVDKVYVSDIDLNVEHGKIEIPHKATLRIATIIHDSGSEPLGILIINYNMGEYLLSLSYSPICNVVIFDQNGMVIQHNDKEKMFGTLLGTDYSYYATHPEFEENEHNGIFQYYDEIHQHYSSIGITEQFSTERYWHFVCEDI